MKDFVEFLQSKVYQSIEIPEDIINRAFSLTIKDIQYHLPEVTEEDVKNRIHANSNELAIFLFRLGSLLHQEMHEKLTSQIHWLLKELCSCEIYFNNHIGEGFYIIHGQGTVMGSRNKIGKGFKIHHGCTIGHRKNGEGTGNVLGDNITMYCNSSILGQLNIGNNVIIGAHVLIKNDVKDNTIIVLSDKNCESEIRN